MTDRQKKYHFLKSILARRFIIYILLFSTLITLLSTTFQLYLDYRKDTTHIQTTLEQIKSSHLQSITSNVWVSDQEQINIHLLEILSLPDIQFIEITSATKEKIHFGTRESRNILSCEYPLVYSFRNKDINLGSLYIEATLDNISQRLFSRVSVILLAQGIKIFLVSLFIFIVFYLLVGRHLITMADYASGFDLKTINTPIKLHRSERGKGDELDMVVSSLNQMRTSIMEDIIRKKKSEEELRRWGHIFENARWGIALGGVEGKRFELINPAYAEMHGYTVDELLEKEISDMFVPSSREKLPEIIKKCHDIGHFSFEEEHIRKDGSTFPAYHDVTTVKNENGQVLYRIISLLDITDRKHAEADKEKLEEQLRQASKMEAVGTMAGGIAHDFNNILAIILGNAEMALDDIPPGNPAIHNIDELLDATNRAKNLVRQILAFSRKEQTELIPIRPQSLIKETLKLLRSTTPTTISILQKLSQDCGLIMADPTQLHQLIMNLFTNAVYAMDEKGEITVSLKEVHLNSDDFDTFLLRAPSSAKTPGRYAQLSVTDVGTGMDNETIERIFDPFYTTKDVGKGTGMGLSVVHGIVVSHGGFIAVESEVGKGSSFHVFLPATGQEETHTSKKTTPLQTGTERIFLIDDEESILVIAKRMLQGLGYKVRAENSSVHALEIFRATPDQFDLIITDQSMPEMSGSELIVEILKIRPDIPIILCTGYSTKVSEETASEQGISKYMNKPYSKRVLSEGVREVLDGKLEI